MALSCAVGPLSVLTSLVMLAPRKGKCRTGHCLL